MSIDTAFSRYEEKYLLTKPQLSLALDFFSKTTIPDEYPNYRVNSIYYDTAKYDIVLRSMRKPVYKEKLRLRCYGDSFADCGAAFLELKKKYRGISYKRRIILDKEVISGLISRPPDFSGINKFGQIAEEISGFINSLESIASNTAITYNRTALLGDKGLRVTFDEDILLDGKYELLPRGCAIMEIKIRTDTAIPVGTARFLSENQIFPAVYSKYATAYTNHIKNKGAEKDSICLT